MLIAEICEILEADSLDDVKRFDKEINLVCGSDLMSDVLTFVKPGSLLLTGLTNPQVVRTAEMADVAVVCFVRGKKPPQETIELAKEKNIPLLVTKLLMYECCGRLHKKGLKGGDGSE